MTLFVTDQVIFGYDGSPFLFCRVIGHLATRQNGIGTGWNGTPSVTVYYADMLCVDVACEREREGESF